MRIPVVTALAALASILLGMAPVPAAAHFERALGERPVARPAALKVGVTLHPYYSWTRNVAGDLPIEVRPILPGDVDAGRYQPTPGDIKKLADLDAIVVNGIGHDDFIFEMIKASGNAKIVVIRVNQSTPQIRGARGEAANSHTFISFTNAIQQSYAIEKALAELRPEMAATLRANAAAYAKRLRAIKAAAAARLAGAKVHRVVTVHDGYGYFLQEFGIEVAGVLEPAHGLVPSASELSALVDLIKKENVKVVLSEEGFSRPMLDVLEKNGKARVFIISHIASGAYTEDKFEVEMTRNADTLVIALTKDP